MKRRFHVMENGRRFASIHASSAEEAVRMACRITGREPEACEATPVWLDVPEKTVDKEE